MEIYQVVYLSLYISLSYCQVSRFQSPRRNDNNNIQSVHNRDFWHEVVTDVGLLDHS